MYDLGIWARVIIGALAGVAALLLLSPTSTFSLLATAIVAGSAGTAIFRSLQDRLLAAMAQKDAADTRAVAEAQNAKVNQALEAFDNLRQKLVEQSTSRPGMTALEFSAEAGAVLDTDDLDRVDRLLSEARGIHKGVLSKPLSKSARSGGRFARFWPEMYRLGRRFASKLLKM